MVFSCMRSNLVPSHYNSIIAFVLVVECVDRLSKTRDSGLTSGRIPYLLGRDSIKMAVSIDQLFSAR
jgi:hypothetical protein